MPDAAEKAINIGIALVIVASLVPMGLVMISNASLENVDPVVVTVITILIPVLACVSVALAFYR